MTVVTLNAAGMKGHPIVGEGTLALLGQSYCT